MKTGGALLTYCACSHVKLYHDHKHNKWVKVEREREREREREGRKDGFESEPQKKKKNQNITYLQKINTMYKIIFIKAGCWTKK